MIDLSVPAVLLVPQAWLLVASGLIRSYKVVLEEAHCEVLLAALVSLQHPPADGSRGLRRNYC